MSSTRPIRALLRGLEVLHVLNKHNGATVSEVASTIDLPRTTTYRILETLCVAGYAYRAASDERYRLTIMVRGLSDGFDDEAWVTQIARPYMYELCRELVWPVAIATLSGSSMILIAANQDTVFGRLANAMGKPELAKDPRYATHSARGEHQAELDDLVADWTRTIDADALESMMEEHGIPSGKIYRAPEMLEDAQFKAREAIIKTMHPKFGELRMQNVAPKLSATPGGVHSPAPDLGQHTDEIFGELLGFDADRLAALRAGGII